MFFFGFFFPFWLVAYGWLEYCNSEDSVVWQKIIHMPPQSLAV